MIYNITSLLGSTYFLKGSDPLISHIAQAVLAPSSTIIGRRTSHDFSSIRDAGSRWELEMFTAGLPLPFLLPTIPSCPFLFLFALFLKLAKGVWESAVKHFVKF